MANNEEPQNVTVPEGDDALVLALAGGKSRTAAAAIAGVCRDTVYRRLQDPAFRARIDAARRGWIERASGRLADNLVRLEADAVRAVSDALQDAEEPGLRLRAALAIIERSKVNECQECKRRAEETANPKPLTLDEMLARDRETIRAYEALQAEYAEAKRLNAEEEAREAAAAEEARVASGMPKINVLAYADQDLEDTGSRNGSA